MGNKILNGIIIVAILLMITLILTLNNQTELFIGLKPKAIYREYRIYDVVEQKGLPCAEAIEILDSDETYDYYFNCLKSDKIYFVSEKEVINIHEAYARGIITKEKLYKLNIIDRMVRLNGKQSNLN